MGPSLARDGFILCALVVAALPALSAQSEFVDCGLGQRPAVLDFEGRRNAEITLERAAAAVNPCRVLVDIGSGGKNHLRAIDSYDYVITESLERASWLGRSGKVHFLDGASWRLDDDWYMHKAVLLSVLLPPRSSWDGLLEALHAEAISLGVEVFVDDGTVQTHDAAFRNATFTWIVETRQDVVHPALVRAFGHHAIPVYSGWVLFTNMYHNAVLRLAELKRGAVVELLWQLRMMIGSGNEETLHNYHHTILDILLYRYRAPLDQRVHTAVCGVCQKRSTLAVVGVYSAVGNHKKRAAVRETWGRILRQQRVSVTFFLGSKGNGNSDVAEDEAQVEAESEQHKDVVRLPVPEGYSQNANKGLAFLRYQAEHFPDVEFLIKIDDDVYWRPEGLLQMLEQRVPFRYIWGFLDLGSPVPRETEDPFYLTKEEWPDDIFPPYPRGALRVMSFDVVRLLAEASRHRSCVVRGDDPSLGVHLRQLVMQDGEFLQIDDRGAMTRFAMEPTCHIDGAYCPLKNTSWMVHHISARAMRCMFHADVHAGYYIRRVEDGAIIRPLAGEHLAEMKDSFPSLCDCVDEPSWKLRRHLQPRCPLRPKGGFRVHD